jgi:poly(A)-specific ribonuclease
MTGVIFLKMLAVITDCSGNMPVDLEHDRVKTCLNKLYLMRSDIPFLKIDGAQDMPSREHVFRIFDFPKVIILIYRVGLEI